MAAKPLTAKRLELLTAIAAGEVTYQPSRAKWFQRGAEATGWGGRSLRELRQDGLVEVPEPSAPSATVTVTLTDAGRTALGRAGDTPPTG